MGLRKAVTRRSKCPRKSVADRAGPRTGRRRGHISAVKSNGDAEVERRSWSEEVIGLRMAERSCVLVVDEFHLRR